MSVKASSAGTVPSFYIAVNCPDGRGRERKENRQIDKRKASLQ